MAKTTAQSQPPALKTYAQAKQEYEEIAKNVTEAQQQRKEMEKAITERVKHEMGDFDKVFEELRAKKREAAMEMFAAEEREAEKMLPPATTKAK